MSTPTSSKRKAPAKTPAAKTPGFARGLFGLFSRYDENIDDTISSNDKKDDDDTQISKTTSSYNSGFVPSRNMAPDFISGTPQLNRNEMIRTSLTLGKQVVPKTNKSLDVESSPWEPQRKYAPHVQQRATLQPAFSSGDASGSFQLGSSRNMIPSAIQNENEISRIQARRQTFKPTRIRKLLTKSNHRVIRTGLQVPDKSKEIAQNMREALSLFQPNQVLLMDTVALNRTTNGYTQFSSRGRLLSKRSRFRPLPTNAAVVVTGNKHGLEDDNNENINVNKKQKVTFEGTTYGNRDRLPSPAPSSMSSSSPSRTARVVIDVLPTQLCVDSNRSIELEGGTNLLDQLEIDSTSVSAQPIYFRSAPGKFVSKEQPPASGNLLLVKTSQATETKPQISDVPDDSTAKEPKRLRSDEAWTCKDCQHVNFDDMLSTCETCGAKRMDREQATGWGNLFANQKKTWQCSVCLSPNNLESTSCASCESPRHENTGDVAVKSTSLPLPSSSTTSTIPGEGASIGSGGFVFPATNKGTTSTDSDSGMNGSGAMSFSFGAGNGFTGSSVTNIAAAPVPLQVGFTFSATNPKFNTASDGVDNKLDGGEGMKNNQGFVQPFAFGAGNSIVHPSSSASVHEEASKDTSDVGVPASLSSPAYQLQATQPTISVPSSVWSNISFQDKLPAESKKTMSDATGFSSSKSTLAVPVSISSNDSRYPPALTQNDKKVENESPAPVSTEKVTSGTFTFGVTKSSQSGFLTSSSVGNQLSNDGSTKSSERLNGMSVSDDGTKANRRAQNSPDDFQLGSQQSKKETNGRLVSQLAPPGDGQSKPFQFGAPASSSFSTSGPSLLSQSSERMGMSKYPVVKEAQHAAPTASVLNASAAPVPSYPFAATSSVPANSGVEPAPVPFGSSAPFSSVTHQKESNAASFLPSGSGSFLLGVKSSSSATPATSDSTGFSASTNQATFGLGSSSSTQGPAPFGASSSSGAPVASVPFSFGSANTTAPPIAAPPASGGFQFGSSSTIQSMPTTSTNEPQAQTASFGQQGGFGQSSSNAGPFSFGAHTATPAASFGAPAQSSVAPAATSFGAPAQSSAGITGFPPMTGTPGFSFGQQSAPVPTGMGGFGQMQQTPNAAAFGGGDYSSASPFGSFPSAAPTFGAQPMNVGFGVNTPVTTNAGGFGSQTPQVPNTGTGGFGSHTPAMPVAGFEGQSAGQTFQIGQKPVQIGQKQGGQSRRIVRAKRPSRPA